MKGIEIPVFENDENSAMFQELNIKEPPLSDCRIGKIMFYRVDGVGCHVEDGEEYGVVLANGMEFISPVRYHKLVAMINSHA